MNVTTLMTNDGIQGGRREGRTGPQRDRSACRYVLQTVFRAAIALIRPPASGGDTDGYFALYRSAGVRGVADGCRDVSFSGRSRLLRMCQELGPPDPLANNVEAAYAADTILWLDPRFICSPISCSAAWKHE